MEKVPYIDDQQLLIDKTANIIKFHSIEAGYNTKLSVSLENLYWFLEYFNIDIIIYNTYTNNGWKDKEFLKGLLKNPSVGASGVNAIFEEVKKQG